MLGDLRRKAPYFAYRAGSEVAQRVPSRLASLFASAMGELFSRGMTGRRTMLARHLRRVHGPSMTDEELDREVRRAFNSYARYWMESFRLPAEDPASLDKGMSWEGIEHVEVARAEGNGVIMAAPHMGGWDFGGAWLAGTMGYEVTAVVERLEPPELFEWFAAFRRSLGLNVVPLGPEAGTAVLKALRANQIVGLICDRDILGTGVEVEFFGERTTLPSGPATLALRTGAAILPTAIYFRGRHHHGVVRPPVPVERTDKLRDDVTRITQLIARELEALIRIAPDQWHLMQPNWPSDREVVR